MNNLRNADSSSEHSGSLRVGVGVADITPPLEVGILMSSVERRSEPFEGIRAPLLARAVIVERGARRVAMVSLELLGLDGEAVGGMRRFKERIVAAGQHVVVADALILAATHTHSAPESLGLSDLFRTECFKNWVAQLAEAIGACLRYAEASLQPCRLVAGVRSLPGLAINRRIKTTRGILLSSPEPPPEIVLSRDGPVDDSVHIAAFIDTSGRPAALLINATCHPVHEMCIRQIAPDYPGEMSRQLERQHPGLLAMFFNGAAGNINPPTVSGGDSDARRHGRILAELIEESLPNLQPVADGPLAVGWQTVPLPARRADGRPAEVPLLTSVAVVRIGAANFLFLPGEPFVETALAIREQSAGEFTAVIGYTDAYIGYIPTDRAFDEGGYETGPGRWCRVDRGSEPTLRRAATGLLRRVPD
jgi:neutral ceramidase